jgi:tRNA:m(5)U-54 methyltransferase
MRRLGSLVMRAADANRVPAGAALAVDRERFAQAVTDAVAAHPRITVAREEIVRIPDDPSMFPLIIATGPLTSDSLSKDIAALVGGDHLYFYDAISPIVLSETIDRSKVFRASRWGRSLRGTDGRPFQAHLSRTVGRPFQGRMSRIVGRPFQGRLRHVAWTTARATTSTAR